MRVQPRTPGLRSRWRRWLVLILGRLAYCPLLHQNVVALAHHFLEAERLQIADHVGMNKRGQRHAALFCLSYGLVEITTGGWVVD